LRILLVLLFSERKDLRVRSAFGSIYGDGAAIRSAYPYGRHGKCSLFTLNRKSGEILGLFVLVTHQHPARSETADALQEVVADTKNLVVYINTEYGLLSLFSIKDAFPQTL
jgi:hypothetical protein